MKRLLWLGIGLAVGGLVVRAVSRRARAYTPQGMAASARESVGGLADSVRSFIDDVRTGMAEREQEIHEAMLAGVAIDDDADFPIGADDHLDRGPAGSLDDHVFQRTHPQEGPR